MKHDCIFLLADGHMEQTFKGFLSRNDYHRKLDTRPFTFDIIVDRQNADSGVYVRGHEFLRQYHRTHQHAIAVLDQMWEGAPATEAIQATMKNNLTRNGWQAETVEIIVIQPELEVWLWQDAPYMAEILRFNHQPHDSLKQWLEAQGHWHPTDSKPARPKEAFEAIQRASKRPFSGATCSMIAQKISIKKCQDTAFFLLRDTLQRWFPAHGGQQ
jgi:hypothetical protein